MKELTIRFPKKRAPAANASRWPVRRGGRELARCKMCQLTLLLAWRMGHPSGDRPHDPCAGCQLIADVRRGSPSNTHSVNATKHPQRRTRTCFARRQTGQSGQGAYTVRPSRVAADHFDGVLTAEHGERPLLL